VIPTTANNVWVSRLRNEHFADHLGFAPDPDNEIPHLRGLPVQVSLPRGAVTVTEWPNLAGRCEPSTENDVVRWCRPLASEPPTGSVVPYGDVVGSEKIVEMGSWLGKFARSLMQLPGVSIPTQSESPRIIVLTPRGVRHVDDLPNGITPVPRRLAEFAGGVILTMDHRTFDQRLEYAETVRGIIEEA
jgi:hypothetical protein